MEKQSCIILTGPTAVGKTELSLRLAEQLNGSIISADSMQVYRRMDIGSAKIRSEEMRGIPHYLIDVLEPEEEFDVYVFQRMAREAMREIWDAGRLPVITGGTGFYIQALLRDVDFSEESVDPDYREKLETVAGERGAEYLHEKLRACDPVSAEEIHPHNVKRVIRALEFYHETGRPISEHNREQREKESPYRYAYFVLNDRREKLYAEIDRRVDRMIEGGLEEEVRKLREEGLTADSRSMKGLGYREFFPYFEGKCTLDETIAKIKLDTRHFAKRQITWFKRERDVIWVNKDEFHYDEDAILDFMMRKWEEIQEA